MIAAAFRVVVFTLVLTLITGLVYPLAVTGIAQAVFPYQASGSLIQKGDKIIGSSLIAQNFTGDAYFQPRPSSAGNGYDGASSSGSNYGVTSRVLNDTFAARIDAEKKANGEADIPADLITASGSGLDPHITPEAALYQVPRIAKARDLKDEAVQALVTRMTEGRSFGMLGMPRVNVLAINLELDKMAKGLTSRPSE